MSFAEKVFQQTQLICNDFSTIRNGIDLFPRFFYTDIILLKIAKLKI